MRYAFSSMFRTCYDSDDCFTDIHELCQSRANAYWFNGDKFDTRLIISVDNEGRELTEIGYVRYFRALDNTIDYDLVQW